MTNPVREHTHENTDDEKRAIQQQLSVLAQAFNAAFGSHRMFPLNAAQRVQQGERVSIYSGTPDEWTAAIHCTYDATTMRVTHTLALTQKPLPARMREHLSAAGARFEASVRSAANENTHA